MTDHLITLKSGKVASETALRRLWTLEARGVRFSLRDDGRVHVAPGGALSARDRAFVVEHQGLLMDILTATYSDQAVTP